MLKLVYYDLSKSTGMNLFVLNSDTIYRSILLAYLIESTQFQKCLYKANQM
jgi:hypothetical protein